MPEENKNNSVATGQTKRTHDWFSNLSTGVLVGLPASLGLLIGAIWVFIFSKPYSGKLWEVFLICLILFLWGSSGLMIVIRKEYPSPSRIHGTQAILIGGFVFVFFWGIALWILINHFL
jgi:hypothetical protein